MTSTKRILVIDDEEAIRSSFRLALEDTVYQVDTAASGEEGIERARSTRYALILLDLRMPGIDGVTTLHRLREIDRDVPIYIVTAFHEEFFDRLREAQADGLEFEVARKPLDAGQILLLTRAVLEKAVAF